MCAFYRCYFNALIKVSDFIAFFGIQPVSFEFVNKLHLNPQVRVNPSPK